MQEVVPGDESNLWICSCTFDTYSEIVSSFIFKKISTSPAHYGVTSYVISQDNNQLLELAAAVGKNISYVGPVDIEFKFDQRDNTYKYIEINPRIGMCTYFDTYYGVNNIENAYYITADRADLIKSSC